MDQRVIASTGRNCRVPGGCIQMDQAVDQAVTVAGSLWPAGGAPGFDWCPMRNVNLESDRGYNLICGGLHALDISVLEAADVVARVVSRESLSQPYLDVATRISSEIIIDKNLGTGSHVPTRV